MVTTPISLFSSFSKKDRGWVPFLKAMISSRIGGGKEAWRSLEALNWRKDRQLPNSSFILINLPCPTPLTE
jgi:hypothetical protein